MLLHNRRTNFHGDGQVVNVDYKKNILLFPSARENLFVTELYRSNASFPRAVPLRKRNVYILHVVTKGTAVFEGFRIIAGEAFLISRNLLHKFSFTTGFDHFWIGFGGNKAEGLLSSFDISPHRHSAFIVENIAAVTEYLKKQLCTLAESKDERQALCTLLHTLAHLRPVQNQCRISPVEQAKYFIDNNYQHHISMEMIADTIKISEKHLCRLFNNQFDISPQKYLIRVRMENAQKLLMTTDMLIKEIAANVGFSSSLAFSSAYKNHFGKPPSCERR